MTQSFVHLHLHSAYSLAEGAIKVKDLVKMACAHQMPAVAITDTNNLFGAMEFALEASRAGLQPILGCQISVDSEGHQIVLLVQNDAGYRNLCRIISEAYTGEDGSAAIHAKVETLAQHSEGLIALSGGIKGTIAQSLLHGQPDKAKEQIEKLKTIYGDRFYIELQRHNLPEEDKIEDDLIDLAYEFDIPLVATNDCYFPDSKAHEAHDALLCISEGRYVMEEDRRKVTPEHYFKSPDEMIKLFEDLPEAIENTLVIAQRCSYLLKPINPILPAFKTEAGRSEFEELKAQSEEGLKWRLENYVRPQCHSDRPEEVEESSNDADRKRSLDCARGDSEDREKAYWERLEYELGIINEMGFPGYFLIVSDFIKWAKEHNIPVGPGRGSGAGSVVAWALKITDLDPLALGLLFERFLNPERVSMPDFDVDFCQDRRDEVIKYVQNKYGYDRVAQIITFGKLQARAVVRDVGRVLQMPYGQVDRIAKLIPNNPAHPMTLQEALDSDADLRAERDKDEVQGKLIDIALQLEGLYRHASTHAAGVVIGDRPLQELVPLYRDQRSDMPVTQFNMKYVEQAGLVKFDFLGLKTMTVVQKSIELISQTHGKDIDILEIPLNDENAYKLMASGNTVGVFQLESAGMRDTLRKVKPNRFEDIIALVSLYRPGPMDNIPKYIDVKEEREEPDYMHPVLQPFLEETYGIMIYQEQVMQAAQELAGYTLGSADLLRRAMGKKIKEEMDEQRKMFVDGAKEHHQVPKEKSSYIFDQIAKFAGYGFNKSHAAAYALIAYWTAWLKANYPVEFFTASMTLDRGNTDKLAVFKQDMDKMGISLYPPDMNKSLANFKVEGKAVRYALAALKGVGEQAMEDIITERSKNGDFKDLADFISRLDPKHMNRRQFEQLICAGAFDSLHDNRADLLGGAELLLRHAQSLKEERESGQVSLFGDDGPGSNTWIPELPNIRPWSPLEKLSREFSSVGFYLSAHPLDTRMAQLERMNINFYRNVEEDLRIKQAGHYNMAGVLLKKQEKMSQKGSKYAFLQISDPTGVFEVTIFSETLAATRSFLEAGTSLLLKVEGEVRDDQMRFTGGAIKPLEESLESKINEIHINLKGDAALPKIKQFLDIEGQGKSQIRIYADLEDERTAEIILPGRWNLSSQARNIIRCEEGVLKISEI
ncbi:MAG: DNA polymerase III subunit alpha [Alphaproteobacteria bacterium]|nr:DNA polymerase III subunit alpha [Alphaproteobacteria bacterium]